MKSSPTVSLLALFLLLIISGAALIDRSGLMRLFSASFSENQSAFDKREAAYRANNVGVALLEQYKSKEAAEEFKRALEIVPDLPIGRINLSIALYYLPDAEAARHEAEKAVSIDPRAPQPHYILGLIARAQDRFDDAVAEFEKVLRIDADDVGTNINLGQIFVQQKNQPAA